MERRFALKFKRLDKVIYRDEIAYIHHLSEEGFTPTAWLYGISESKKITVFTHEPVDLRLITKLERNTDYTKFIDGYVGIDHLQMDDRKELLNVCDIKGIDISDADTYGWYKGLWYISENKLKTVQNKFEVKSPSIQKVYGCFVEFISDNEKIQNCGW